VTNYIIEKGKDYLAPRIFTTNCNSVTEIYLLQCNGKECFVAVGNNYKDVFFFVKSVDGQRWGIGNKN